MNSNEIKLLFSTPLDDDVKGIERLRGWGLLRLTFEDQYVLSVKGDNLVGVLLQVARLATHA